MDFLAILNIVKNAPAAVAQAASFKQLFDQAITLFKPAQQQQLKDAYAKAIAGSDDAQGDFVDASRGR